MHRGAYCAIVCALAGGCADQPSVQTEGIEPVAEARQMLSFSATAAIAISDNGCSCVPGGWRPNGIVYNDNASRCVSQKNDSYSSNDVMLVKFGNLPSCAPLQVLLQLTTTQWDAYGSVPARIRKVLKPWTPPPAVCPNGCVGTNHVGWVLAQGGSPWSKPGASALGVDVSSTFIDEMTGTGVVAHIVDITSSLGIPYEGLRLESPGTGGQPGNHYWAASSVTLHITCAGSAGPSSAPDEASTPNESGGPSGDGAGGAPPGGDGDGGC